MLTTLQKIKHLYWRAGFGYSPQEWRNLKSQSLDQAIEQLFREAAMARGVEAKYQDRGKDKQDSSDPEAKKAARKQDRQFIIQQNAQWLTRMADPQESSLLEKMCLFWHGHFACVINHSKLSHQQLNTIRAHALGNFSALVKAIARDPAMIRFLNNQQNRKRQPNENFARELLELFTIGRGNYSEKDIKEAARAFTGWSSDFRGNFKFKKFQHDNGQKTFMGKTGNFDGDDIIDIILERKETALFITRKIYRYFVNEVVDENHLTELADYFYRNQYDISKLLRKLFSSTWFYEAPNIGTKIKSPVELLAGMMRSLKVTFDGPMPLVFIQKALGQILFRPPNVAGWPGGQKWIDNSTLLFRLNLAAYLFQAADVNFRTKEEFEAKQRNQAVRKIKADFDLYGLAELTNKKSAEDQFKTLKAFFLQANSGLQLSDIDRYLSSEKYLETLTLRLLTLPEYQMC